MKSNFGEFLCYNCIYLKDWTGNVIKCQRIDRLWNPKTKCDYFKEQWTGGKDEHT